MKNILSLFLIAVISISAMGQTNIPQLVSFSAVVRDGTNQPLVNTAVSIRLTFREGGQTGPLVYCALHQTTTNQNGFMSLQLNRDVLGTGCNGAPSTAFENIPWDDGGFWMEVEYQTTPGSPFENLGQLELASSFYAFAAGTAESISGMELTGASNGDVLTYNITSGQWEPMPSGGGFSGDYNDLTNQPTIPSNTSDLTNNSGFITNPDDADADPTNELQTISEANGVLSLSNSGGSVTLTDADSTNELQNLSVSSTGDTLYLQNGGFVIIPGISAANAPPLAIGDSYQGGIIFYLDGFGGGLIAAPSDQSTAAPWGCYGTGISGADGTAVGTGNQNTIDIEAGCATVGIAADICANLTLGGYSDWFLPSKDELNQMYLNKAVIGGFTGGFYWSSTEYDHNEAWEQYFYDGGQNYHLKANAFYVRAVRAF